MKAYWSAILTVIQHGVAESQDNKDAKVWTFHLRKDAKWSDGTPVTAQDFVYSWQRSVDPNTASPYASYLQYGHIAGIDEILEGKTDYRSRRESY